MSDQEINSLLDKISNAYPNLSLKPGSRFLFRPPRTVFYNKDDKNFALLIMHEIGHAILGNSSFKTDIERLKIERNAWDEAKKLCKKFNIPFNKDLAEDELDSYRNWLHQKSLCKTCGLTRYQTIDGKYHCPKCENL